MLSILQVRVMIYSYLIISVSVQINSSFSSKLGSVDQYHMRCLSMGKKNWIVLITVLKLTIMHQVFLTLALLNFELHNSLLWGWVPLCIVGLAPSLASTHWKPVATRSPRPPSFIFRAKNLQGFAKHPPGGGGWGGV